MNPIGLNSGTFAEGNGDSDIGVFIKKTLEGDDNAFRYIYNFYSGKMYSLCRRYAGVVDADDLFQEASIKVFRSLANYKGLGSFEGWIRKIFVNTCLDFLKKENKMVFLENMEEEEAIHPSVEAENSITLSSDDLLKIIQGMPDGYRTIVNLYLIEGYSHKEISEMLKINEGTSKSQLSKARAKLQEIILKQNAR